MYVLRRVLQSWWPITLAFGTLAGLAQLLGLSADEVKSAVTSSLTFLAAVDPVLLLLTGILAYLLCMHLLHRNSPLAVTRAELVWEFLDADQETVKTTQCHWLRTHHRNVTAFHQRVAPDPGELSPGSADCWIAHDRESDWTPYGSAKNLEITHTFEQFPLWAWIPIPNWLVAMFNGKHLSIKRRFSARATNAFPLGNRIIAVGTGRYPHYNFSIEILFPNASVVPPQENWEAYRVKDDAMIPLHIEPIERGKKVSVPFSADEFIRISWGEFEPGIGQPAHPQ